MARSRGGGEQTHLAPLTLSDRQVFLNLAFSPDEKIIYVTAVDLIDRPPYSGKVYSIPDE